jgi:hypothetical protein
MGLRIFRFGLSWLVLLVLGVFLPSEIGAQVTPEHLPTFTEQFIFSSVILESGMARLINEDGTPQSGPIPPGSLLKTESIIGVDSEGIAEIRLGCNSIVRLTPGSRLKIRSFGLEFLKGSMMARHAGSHFPLKIQGAATLLISKDSLVDAERDGDKVLARVQVGSLKTPGMKEPVVAGQSIEASGQSATITTFGPLPKSWDSPTLSNQPILGIETSSKPISEQGENQSSNEPPPTQIPPQNGEIPNEAIEGEDWMKKPIPVGQD